MKAYLTSHFWWKSSSLTKYLITTTTKLKTTTRVKSHWYEEGMVTIVAFAPFPDERSMHSVQLRKKHWMKERLWAIKVKHCLWHSSRTAVLNLQVMTCFRGRISDILHIRYLQLWFIRVTEIQLWNISKITLWCRFSTTQGTILNS